MKRMWSRVVPANSATEDIVFTILCIVLVLILAAAVSGVLYVYVMWPLGIWWVSNILFGTTIPLTLKTCILTWVGIVCLRLLLSKIKL
jgi:hypothetical protein